jgi:hypothetical protein
MNSDLKTLLADIRRNPQNYQKYACLCDDALWAQVVTWVTNYDLNQLEQLHNSLCHACPPKGKGEEPKPVLPPTPVVFEPPPVPPPPPVITQTCSVNIPATGQRR